MTAETHDPATMSLPKRIEEEAWRLHQELNRGDRDAARETLIILQAKLSRARGRTHARLKPTAQSRAAPAGVRPPGPGASTSR